MQMLRHGYEKYVVSGMNVRKYDWLRTLEFLLNDNTDLSLRHTP